jgi:hypothetical protein
MGTASTILPVIFYTLLSILIIVAIILLYKLTITVDKANVVLDDIYGKVKKLDNLFEIIDKSADTINTVTDKITGIISNSIMKVFKKRKEDEDE